MVGFVAQFCTAACTILKGFIMISTRAGNPLGAKVSNYVLTRKLALPEACILLFMGWPGASAELRSFAKQIGRGVPTSGSSLEPGIT